MKDSVEFHINFIAEIEKNPELYNYNLENYSNKRRIKVLWTRIGEKFNETADDCKNKWKSIRSSYMRSLNTKTNGGSGAGPKKKYYLAKYLQFLNPFMKHKQQEGNSPIQDAVNEATPEREYPEESHIILNNKDGLLVDSHSKDEGENRFNLDSSVSPICSETKTKKPISGADRCVIEYFTLKKRKLDSKKSSSELFLLSLVTHMEQMTERQQLSFRRQTLQLLEDIKYPRETDEASAS